jgi:hypothetical protein
MLLKQVNGGKRLSKSEKRSRAIRISLPCFVGGAYGPKPWPSIDVGRFQNRFELRAKG